MRRENPSISSTAANAGLVEPGARLLVAILNHPRDLALAKEAHWYRIPVESAKKWLAGRWPPQWLAFYQTKVFGSEAFRINYYGQVLNINRATGRELFPNQPSAPKSEKKYFRINLSALKQVTPPIRSRRWRRIIFIPTTWEKFVKAREINDLYDESPLEDLLWAEFKNRNVVAERQEFITANKNEYALDFAIYCARGKIDVETDGDTWHADPQRIPLDNRRDNDLETSGWKLFRFNTCQLREQMVDYCVPTILENIRRLGGLDEGRVIPRDIPTEPSAPSQLSLFDD